MISKPAHSLQSSLITLSLALAFSACAETAGPGDPGRTPVELEGLIVSEPVLAHSSLGTNSVEAGVTYVSLPPGTLPFASSVQIRNQTTGASATTPIPIVDGGFDPVAVAATAGDVLELTVTANSGTTTVFSANVPVRRPPFVVRTNPEKGRIDVALNVRPTVIFSEPIDPRSLTTSSVTLVHNDTPVPGTTALVPGSPWSAEFIPASPLQPFTTYEMLITQDIRDPEGEPLGAPVRFTFTTTGEVFDNAGGRIVFVSYVEPVGGHVYTINPDGSELKRLTDVEAHYSRPQWSPDGRRILFTEGIIGGESSVHVMNADGSALTRLHDGLYATWSPDGSQIAFSSMGEEAGIYLMDAHSPFATTRLTEAVSDPCAAHGSWHDNRPDWSPDGRKIAFKRLVILECPLDPWFGGAAHRIYVVNIDGTELRPLLSDTTVASLATDHEYDPAWSPDGLNLAYWSHMAGLAIIDSEGIGPARSLYSAPPPYYFFPADRIQPAWSPDGQYLAFTNVIVTTEGPMNRIRIVEIESGLTRELMINGVPGAHNDPHWSHAR